MVKYKELLEWCIMRKGLHTNVPPIRSKSIIDIGGRVEVSGDAMIFCEEYLLFDIMASNDSQESDERWRLRQTRRSTTSIRLSVPQHHAREAALLIPLPHAHAVFVLAVAVLLKYLFSFLVVDSIARLFDCLDSQVLAQPFKILVD